VVKYVTISTRNTYFELLGDVRLTQEIKETEILRAIKNQKEIFWMNPNFKETKEANKQTPYSMATIQDVEDRLQRFASYFQVVFPETQKNNGLLESKITEISQMKQWLEDQYNTDLPGKLYLKRDDLLPISGTIKSRGAIYEVLKYAETLALEAGLLESIDTDYEIFASDEFHQFFSNYNLTVGTTGNLGISVGAMGRALGFEVTVHMSADARQWKKTYLRERGVDVVEHSTNFSKAVEIARQDSDNDPSSYFVDDEYSEELFLGYTVGGYRMKKQLAEEGITVDEKHPLFVYLPCGIGGSPSGITFGLKQAFGDNVHCFFAEPTKMPSLLIGLGTQLFDKIAVEDIGLGSLTVADGLAVPRTSALVAKMMDHYFSGSYTLTDETFHALLTNLYEQEDIFLEPAAVAGLPGPFKLLSSAAGQKYLKDQDLLGEMKTATHIAWGTGGSMVPKAEKLDFIAQGKNQNIKI
jgi:D-serine dehydratase